MFLDIVICTYNRPQRVMELVTSLQNAMTTNGTIIVVDSSDLLHESLMNWPRVKYLHSKHKNQPFQRYIGYANSAADFILYLDDDMELVEHDFETIILTQFKQDNLVGLALHFEDKSKDTSLAQIPKSELFNQTSFIKKCLNWFTGYPNLPSGKFGLCGVRGRQPIGGGRTEWISGGAFVAKRESLYKNFNFQLFDLFEQKVGMGEDAILGYTLSKEGEVIYLPNLFFYHNDQKDSSYSLDAEAFSKRVVFSRLFLSMEKSRLDGSSLFFARMHFQWHTFWRVIGFVANYYRNKSTTRKNILKGAQAGWLAANSFIFDKKLSRTLYWKNQLSA